MYHFFSNFMPKKMRDSFRQLLVYANIKMHPDKFIGFMLIFGLSVSLVLAFDLFIILQINFFILFIGIFVLVELGVYVWFLLSVDRKSKFIESILPDALQLMASNLRAGITTDRALLLSARPEFGPFKDELNRVGKEIATGKEIGDALRDMTKRIKSEVLQRTVQLIVSGLKSGGELATLLEQNSEDLRNQDLVDKKIRSSVQMYVIFIFSAIGLGAPVLFGLSSILVKIISKSFGMLDIPANAQSAIPITLGGVTLSSGFVLQYTLISLATTSILGSLVLGLISGGKEKDGIKYIPMLLVSSAVVFFSVRYILTLILGGLFEV